MDTSVFDNYRRVSIETVNNITHDITISRMDKLTLLANLHADCEAAFAEINKSNAQADGCGF